MRTPVRIACLVAALAPASARDGFDGSKPGDEKTIAGVKLCWCPPGRFTMGSPPGEPERRPGEDQVEVTLTRGFWAGKYEVTQGDWKRIVGKLPGELTAELPEGDDYPVGNVNFAEAEAFCRTLTPDVVGRGDATGRRREPRHGVCPVRAPARRQGRGRLLPVRSLGP
jgi:formylglycine-generating enzyme required for sulfatase activity